MIEKVNPSHPDKVADRIAGAIVDLAYKKKENPIIAVEILLGHGEANIIIESNEEFSEKEISDIVKRLSGISKVNLKVVKQDEHLAENQSKNLRCGDNGIFKGVPLNIEDKEISKMAREIYKKFPYDGKYIYDHNSKTRIICQSNAKKEEIEKLYPGAIVNPIGDWTGGPNVDSGATNRKLGSDMNKAVTGGGLHGKDLSKADVSVNIYAFLKAQEENREIDMYCAIGDENVNGIPYKEIVETARKYIKDIGGFEKLAEWGLT